MGDKSTGKILLILALYSVLLILAALVYDDHLKRSVKLLVRARRTIEAGDTWSLG